jgi:murein DD-endopeptidase MepM/ murein hydrolase activator NlpD
MVFTMKKKLLILFTILSCFSFSNEYFYKKTIKQGESNSILLRSKKKMGTLELVFDNKKILMRNIYYSPSKYVYRAIIGTDTRTKVGKKEIKILHYSKPIKNLYFEVEENDFETEFIKLPEKQKERLTNENLTKETNIIGRNFKINSDTAKWKDNFIMPAEGRISSPYGAQRRYNKDNIAWWHKGIDIANKIGTPVFAPNYGTVILTDSFLIHGKTIMLDHGHGIISAFLHLDSIDVQEGQFVKKGQKIATMGNTGNSTGPHLHWGLSVNNVRVNPLQWVENRFAPNYYR